MPVFDYSFTVPAPLEAVRALHHNTQALKKLTPLPIFMQIHYFEPLGEGSQADFTMWFGPLPLRWVAVHSNVDENGFTDTMKHGPLAAWRHTHRFTVLKAGCTRIHEHIEYTHPAGLRGWLTRLLFNRHALYALFTARRLLTRWHLKRLQTSLVRKELAE